MRILILILFFVCCQDLQETEKRKRVARVNSSFLYKSDLLDKLNPGLSYEDSVIVSTSIINNWAIKKLIYSQSLLYLNDSIQKELLKMVEKYKLQLWTDTYRNFLTTSNSIYKIDSLDKIEYYKKNKNSFKLKENIYNVAYVILPKGNNNLKLITSRLRNFSEIDLYFLDSLNYQFNDFMLNKSHWINKMDLLKKIPLMNYSNFQQDLKRTDFFVYKDSLEVYLLKVFDYKKYNSPAPYVTIKKNIEKILINKQKINFFKNLDKEILDNAIQTKQFETFP
tara:strand:- start:151 stop:990 length:840 start_codon:yes stop_codon:yes gene_type:complete